MRLPNVKGKYSYLFFIPVCVVVILLGYTSFANVLNKGFSYIFSPIYRIALESGERVLDWGEALAGVSSYIEEYKSMQEEIARLKIENSEKIIDYEEYEALKEQEQFLVKDSEYLEAKVLQFNSQGDIIINVGRESDVEEGDVVILGKAFIGRVFDVGEDSSLVKLPLSKASNFEVIILDSEVDLNEKNKLDSLVKSKGVVSGTVDSIVIENLSINAELEEGDLVLIRDVRVKDIFLLGTLVNISKNPASTYREGVVLPIFEYSNLLTVFVKVE